MSLDIIDIGNVPNRDGSDFDHAVKERLISAQPVKLSIFTYQQLTELDERLYAGYLVRCSNGDAGAECLAYCDGFNWKVVDLGSNIALS
jgi:hypothetical protein